MADPIPTLAHLATPPQPGMHNLVAPYIRPYDECVDFEEGMMLLSEGRAEDKGGQKRREGRHMNSESERMRSIYFAVCSCLTGG